MTDTPVRIGSRGTSRTVGLRGEPATGRVSPPSMGGPPSRGSPIPFHTRPSHPRPTGISNGRPSNATVTLSGSMPPVPWRTCTTARSPWTSRTRPRRTSPLGSRTAAISSQPTPSTPPTTSRGPSTRRAPVYSIGTRANSFPRAGVVGGVTPARPALAAARRAGFGPPRRRRDLSRREPGSPG